ncbi:S8 family serine peptidase [Amycolatopsis tucumanensis]|uniref:Peptidase S8/S53 domain-containing protein n=1 Tax=Amycolatopsis tucumanensis TaxID=401106 RepID=A0ABP7I9Y2_9PSEU|nr:S8 family serine peptidase [Amycolatopsis tucumanensis]MCF6428622.1 S8 family serine peptidase [Amycolatopsis tucumanensis]
MRWRSTRAVAIAAAVLVLPFTGAVPAANAQVPLAPVSDTLDRVLTTATALTPVTTLVHAADAGTAAQAVRTAGMREITRFPRIGVVAATGTAAQVAAVRKAAGVTYVENNDPLVAFGSSGTTATRSAEARTTLTGADGAPLDGRGVSVAIIDTGIDPTHPAFRGADGSTRVVRNLKSLCLDGTTTSCIVDVPTSVDTDATALGGHGTHVAGIAAGAPYTLADGSSVGGSAPGAKIVSISTGLAILVLGTDAALNWVLENHAAPCGAGVPATVCPPIKVINNSYGPSGGGEFDPESATVKLQRALAAEGVVTVWANGNDGGDGSADLSNPPGKDPTPGVISVASYNDQGTGTRDGTVSDFSSRGLASDPSTWPDVSAPGENILSACRPYLVICATGLQPSNGPGMLDLGTYNVISGTSMATPQITGIVAQLFQSRPDATPGEIEAAIKSTAYKYSDGAPYQGGSSFDKGAGLVDTVAAVGALAGA